MSEQTNLQSANHDVYFVPGLHRGLRVLEVLGAADRPMTLSQIAIALEVGRSSAFRIVYTLRHMGFLKEAEQQNTYTLGARVLNLGFAYLNQQSIIEIARPHLEALRDETGISAHLSVLEGREVLYLDCHQAKSGFISNTTTGSRSRAYASPVGWCLLGSHAESEIDVFCKGQELSPVTAATPTTCEALKARIETARQDGFVLSRGFYEAGGSSVIVPIRDNTGRVAACVDVSGPDSGFDFDRIEIFYIPAVQAAAQIISREMGHSS